MKRRYLFLLLVLLLPIFVYADTCDNSKIVISDLEMIESTGYAEDISSPSINNQLINTNLKLYDVGDSITYRFNIKNNSNEDYDLSKNISNDEYTKYELITDNNKIKAGEEKTVQLKITHQKRVDDSKYNGGRYIQNKVQNIIIGDNIINPSTGISRIIIMVFLFMVFILGSCTFINSNKKYLSLFILFFIPFLVNAACQYRIRISSNIEFKKVIPNPCTYEGELVNNAQYVNGQYTYIYVNTIFHPDVDYNIDSMNLDGWRVILTDKDSTDPVTTKLCTSINNKPIFAMDEMFVGSKATSIDLSSFDTSNVISMSSMFAGVGDISLDLSSFDTRKVYFMQEMFANSLVKYIDVSNFDMHNVRDSSYMFCNVDREKIKTGEYFVGNENTFICESFEPIEFIDCDDPNSPSYYSDFCGHTK